VVGKLYVVGPSSGQTSDNTEPFKVTAIGTAGTGGSGLTVANDSGNGLTYGHQLDDQILPAIGSTLAASASAGATVMKVADTSVYQVGDRVTVGVRGTYEIVVLTSVGTSGSGGTGIGFTGTPLVGPHASGEFAVVGDATYASQRVFTMAPGAIMAQLIDEAQVGRGELPGLEKTFAVAVGSGFAPWGDDVTVTIPVGATLLEARATLIGVGLYTRFSFDTANNWIQMDAYPDDPVNDLSGSVVLHQGKHFQGSIKKATQQAQWRSRILVEGANNTYVEVISGDETLQNRRDGYLSFGNTSDIPTLTAAGQRALAAAAAASAPQPLALFHGDGPGDVRAYDSFTVGDTVAVDVPGTYDRTPLRTVAFSIMQLASNDYAWATDVTSAAYDESTQIKKRLAALASRLVPSSAIASVPSNAIAFGQIEPVMLDTAGSFSMDSVRLSGASGFSMFLQAPSNGGVLVSTTNDSDGTPQVGTDGRFAPLSFSIPSASVAPSGITAPGHTVVVDSLGRLYIRSGGVNHYWARTAGVQIPKDVDGVDETICPRCGRPMEVGQRFVVRGNEVMPDGALHALYEHERCAD
jgi:hypothetical protein